MASRAGAHPQAESAVSYRHAHSYMVAAVLSGRHAARGSAAACQGVAYFHTVLSSITQAAALSPAGTVGPVLLLPLRSTRYPLATSPLVSQSMCACQVMPGYCRDVYLMPLLLLLLPCVTLQLAGQAAPDGDDDADSDIEYEDEEQQQQPAGKAGRPASAAAAPQQRGKESLLVQVGDRRGVAAAVPSRGQQQGQAGSRGGALTQQQAAG
jgi:hypothetical protein